MNMPIITPIITIHGHHHGHGHTISLKSDQSLLAIAASFVPCSGAILILVFCLTNSLIWQGVVMTLMIALGMAITLSAIGLASIFLRRQTPWPGFDSAWAGPLLPPTCRHRALPDGS